MIELRHSTPERWTAVAIADLDAFLQDHAHNERKVSASAMQLAIQHPSRRQLVIAMIDLAIEELHHFKRVHRLLTGRGQTLGQDIADPYMGPLRRLVRKPDSEAFLLDRLLLYAVVEARGCERFTMLAEALDPGPVQALYADLSVAERRHHELFLALAGDYFDADQIARRLGELLDAEAEICRRLPLRPALH
jgi:tRNA-(ms[2]io[6]A)-hydroxylase